MVKKGNKQLFALSVLTFSLNQAVYATDTAQDETMLPTIMVTDTRERGYSADVAASATKTSTAIESIPQSVVVVPKALIEDQVATTLAEALQNVSNVKGFDQRDVSMENSFRIRGFSAGVTVDGVAAPGYFSNQEPIINVEQIDVVKGPTGSLYGASQSLGPGANNVGGMIAITSKAPEKIARREVGIRAGSYKNQAVSFDLNQPINEQFGIRLVGEAQRNNSETDRVTSKTLFIAPSISWKPNATSQLTARMRQTDNTYLDFYGLPAEGTVLPGVGNVVPVGSTIPRNRNFTATDVPDSKIKLGGLNVQWNQLLSDNLSWSVTLAETHTLIDSRNLYPWNFFGMNEVYPSRMWDDVKSTTLSPSITAKFNTAMTKHTVVAGLDFDRTKDDGFIIADLASFTIPDYINPAYPAWVEPASTGPTQTNTYRTDALYVQDQVSLGKLSVLAGLRYARVGVDDINTDPFFLHNTKTTNSKTTPRVGATYEISPNISAFAGYGEGFKVPVGSVYAAPPKPEEAQQTEMGLRLKDYKGISATIACFDLTRRNVTGPGPGGLAVQVGKQNSHGIDIDLNWKVSRDMTWIASVSDQTATIVENRNNTNVGKSLFAVPDTTVRLATRYDFHHGELSGLGLGLGVKYQSKLPGDSSNSFYTPDTTLLDAQASYTLKRVRFDLSVNNLADKKYYVPASGNAALVYPALRRTWKLNANLNF